MGGGGGSFNRERRRDRLRSGSMLSMTSMTSVTSMASSGYWGTGVGEPHRDTDLSLAAENLTLAEIDGNVFRMSKDQVGEA